MKKIIPLISIILLMLFFYGCATSKKVQAVQPGDNSLSCQQLKVELDRLTQAQEDVNSKKGFTGTNFAAALFWVPGLVYTYYDASQATEAISNRRSHITNIYNQKGCH